MLDLTLENGITFFVFIIYVLVKKLQTYNEMHMEIFGTEDNIGKK